MKRFTEAAGRHAGQTAFVLGAGPSLRHVDPERLKCGVTFTVNSAILKMPDCDYWVSDDQDTRNWEYFGRVVMPSSCLKLVDANRLGRYTRGYTGFVNYVRQNWYDWHDPRTGVYDYSKLSMTDDPTRPLAGTRTSVATAVHIAHVMGCSPVVLLGCDCRYEDGKRWFWEFGGYGEQRRAGADRFPNKLFLDDSGDVVSDTHCNEMRWFWAHFAAAVTPRVPVFDCSGGALDAFPRRNISEFECRVDEAAPVEPN